MRLARRTILATYRREPGGDDAAAAANYDAGHLSPRQRAGFYEVAPARFAEAMRAYRARIKRIEVLARWRRSHPAPDGFHFALRDDTRKGSPIVGFAKVMADDWHDYFQAVREIENMTPAKRKKAEAPTPPPGPRPERHDGSMTFYSYAKNVECPSCAGFPAAQEAWLDARAAILELVGVERPNGRWTGSEPARWPDGSWDIAELRYPPLPIRSARAVPRQGRKDDA